VFRLVVPGEADYGWGDQEIASGSMPCWTGGYIAMSGQFADADWTPPPD